MTDRSKKSLVGLVAAVAAVADASSDAAELDAFAASATARAGEYDERVDSNVERHTIAISPYLPLSPPISP